MLRLHISDGVSRAGQLELPTPPDDLKRQMEMLRPPASDHTLHVSSVDSPTKGIGWQVSKDSSEKPSLNRYMADYRNRERGISKAQEQAIGRPRTEARRL